MVGPTAQIAALTCHVNARARGIRTPRFFPANSTCKFCEYVHFVRQKRRLFSTRVQITAATPDEWLDTIADRGCTLARIIHGSLNAPQISDRMSAGFVGGGGRWLLCVERQDLWECWEATWKVGNRDATDSRIWRVQYAVVAQPPTIAPNPASVEEVATQLMDALLEIEAFACRHAPGFADCFARARKCLESDDPLALVYHRDLAPFGTLPTPAARLLASCQAAWVFGGMGSWNDLLFDGEDQQLYERLSGHLYNLVNRGICVSVNETAVR